MEKVKSLSDEQKEKFIKDFEEKLEIREKEPWKKLVHLNEEDTIKVLCFCSTFGRGSERFCIRYFGISKGFLYHFVSGKGRIEIKERYKSLSKEQIISIGEKCWEDWGRPALKKEYKNLRERYPNFSF